MMNTRYYVEIGQPVSRVIDVRSLADARALLWACAKHHTFLPANCERDDGEPLTNEDLRERPLPDPDRYAHFRERIGYWEAALELDDPEDQLAAAVHAALSVFRPLMDENPVSDDPRRFTSLVAEAAEEWAMEQREEVRYELP